MQGSANVAEKGILMSPGSASSTQWLETFTVVAGFAFILISFMAISFMTSMPLIGAMVQKTDVSMSVYTHVPFSGTQTFPIVCLDVHAGRTFPAFQSS